MRHRAMATNEPDLRKVGLHPNFWYPLARSSDLKPGRTLAVAYAEEQIILVRTESGKVFALEDRCAHRQVPLHLGVVAGEQVRCCYHGWCYDSAGNLTGIPNLPSAATPPRGVRCFPSREAYRHIFVFPGRADKAGAVPFPDLPTWHLPQYKTMYFARKVRCHYSFMHENLMDMNHQFLHRRLMGIVKPVLLDYREGTDWIEAEYRFERTGGREHRGGDFLMRVGKGTERTGQVSRDFDLMTIRTHYPYQTLTVCRANSNAPTFALWAAYVPIDGEQRTNYSVGLLMIRRPSLPGLIWLLWPFMRYFTKSIFNQDRIAVEAEQKAHDLQGADWNQEVFPVVLSLRKILIRNGVSLNSSL